MAVPMERRMKRWQEQRWILDSVIRTVGIEWDQPRIAYTAGEPPDYWNERGYSRYDGL